MKNDKSYIWILNKTLFFDLNKTQYEWSNKLKPKSYHILCDLMRISHAQGMRDGYKEVNNGMDEFTSYSRRWRMFKLWLEELMKYGDKEA
jgi:hypothetical protein